MPSPQEAAFNRSVADILIPEYRRQTGKALHLVACDPEFPDLICELPEDSRRLEIELVEIGLFFVAQEDDGLHYYQRRFAEVLAQHRPAYKGTLIRLQTSHAVVSSSRPHRFPHAKSTEAKLIVAEFEELAVKHRERLLPWSACLLRDFVSSSGLPVFPALLRHFDAILINKVPDSYPGRLHGDDPVIDLHSVTQYSMAEIDVAVDRALRSKDKGPSYTADLLVLHTLHADHKPYFAGTAMHTQDIVNAALEHVSLLKGRFNEVWFLNAYFDDTQRLYRIL